MSIESTNIYDLLSNENENVSLPAKPTAKDSKVESKAVASKQTKESEKKTPELGKGRKTEDKSKRTGGKTGGGGDRPPRERPANPNKRVFDRRSGTGRGKEQKKGGAGKGNWGSIEPSEELVAESQPVEEAPKEPVEAEEKPAPAEGTPAPTEAPTEEKPAEEEEDKTLSYEEWKAKNEIKSLELPTPIRHAGEGVDDSAWSEYVPLARETVGEPKSAEKSGEKKKKETTASKLRVDEVFKIQTEEKKSFRGRPSGPRRGAAPRGDNNRNYRGGRGRPVKPFTLNEDAFPSLITKA